MSVFERMEVLRELRKIQGGASSKTICRRVGFTSQKTGGLLNGLEADGLVKGVRSNEHQAKHWTVR